jgi:hypothetical protein
MMTRRHVITGGLVAGAIGATGATGLSAEAAPAAKADAADDNTAVLGEILDELKASRLPERLPGARDMELIRQSRRVFLKQSGKFPDQVEVGLDVWERVLDWFVATGQPLDVGRLPAGQYFVRYVGTNIVLKPELPEGYVSPGADR